MRLPDAMAVRVVVVGAIGLTMSAPGQTLGISVFTDAFSEDLGLGRLSVAGAYMIGTLIAAASIGRIGRLIDLHGVRRATITIGLLFGFPILGLAGVRSWLTLVIAFVGVRILGQGAMALVSTTWVAKTIGHARGGPMSAVLGLGQIMMAFVPLGLTAATLAFGWRTAVVIAAVAVWVIVPLLGYRGMHPAFLQQGYPADQGGDGRNAVPGVASASQSWTRKEALRTGMFWVLTAGWGVGGLVHTAVIFHHFSILSERGLDAATAATVFFPMQAAMLTGMLIVGAVSSRVGPKVVMPLAMVSFATAMVLLIRATTLTDIIIYGAVLGLGMGSVWAQEATYLPLYFGPKHIGAIRGVTSMVNIGLAAIGPLAIAGVNDFTGAYNSALVGFLVVAVALAVTAPFVRVPVLHRDWPPSQPDRDITDALE